MIGTLLDNKLSTQNPFSEKWDDIVDTVATAYVLSSYEKKELHGSKIAKLIAAIPYIAGCEDPRTVAEIHLTTYLLTKKTTRVFDSTPADGVDRFRRLTMMTNFVSGNQTIIEKGICLLALTMLCEYNRTAEQDFELERYNPIVMGAINFEIERQFLIDKINSIPCPFIDEIITTFEAQILWW